MSGFYEHIARIDAAMARGDREQYAVLVAEANDRWDSAWVGHYLYTPQKRAVLAAIDLMTDGHNSPASRYRQLAAIRLGESYGYGLGKLARAIVRDKRRANVAWVTRTQRSWQGKVARRKSHGRHHDSWATREMYVRCHGDTRDYL